MTIINTQAEAEALIKDGTITVNGNLKITCSIKINANITVDGDIDCRNIDCRNIDCLNIDCLNIDCRNIDCRNIDCLNIDCLNIDFYAFAIAYESFKCASWTGRRDNAFAKCLDKEIEIVPKPDDKIIEKDGRRYRLIED
jgi:hypothetical protein